MSKRAKGAKWGPRSEKGEKKDGMRLKGFKVGPRAAWSRAAHDHHAWVSTSAPSRPFEPQTASSSPARSFSTLGMSIWSLKGLARESRWTVLQPRKSERAKIESFILCATFLVPRKAKQRRGNCHNCIFTHEIFSGVDTQNEVAQTKPDWSDEGSPRQITSKRGLGHISRNPTKFSQGWPSLTKVDRGLTKLFLTRLESTMPKNPQNVVRDTFPRVRRVLTKFDQVWLRLTKFDWGLNGPLTRLSTPAEKFLI